MKTFNSCTLLLLATLPSTATAELKPAGIINSQITLTLESVGNVRSAVRSSNLASPVVINEMLYIPDQRGGAVYRFDENPDGGTATQVFDVKTDAPGGLKNLDKFYSILNIADGPGNSVYVVFTSRDLPKGVVAEPLPNDDLYLLGELSYQIVYKYELNPFDGSEGEPDPVVLAAFEQVPGHRGGGLLTLPNGNPLFARGDNLGFNRDGLTYAQDDNFTVSKLLIIDQDTGAITLAARGVRNVQRLTYADAEKTKIAFAEIGANTTDEINVVLVADLLDTSQIENFGWGRIPGDDSDGDGTDGTAREGTFYINAGHTEIPKTTPVALGEASLGEEGFIQPYAQAFSEGADLFALSGPVYSNDYFTSIDALFGDLVSGSIFATVSTDDDPLKPVYQVNLVDVSGEPLNLLAEANALGQDRVDVRFFEFDDGQPGLLSETTGELYRLTETTP